MTRLASGTGRRFLVTGLRGTLAPWVAADVRARGAQVIGWDRETVPPDDEAAAKAWLEQAAPEAIVHLALGSEAWLLGLAAYAAKAGVPLVFVSTAMVFDARPDGPHRPHDTRTARDDYGRYKIRCEDALAAEMPQATIARIGWQIAPQAEGNNMLTHLDQWQARDGCVRASRLWTPACSFMGDTARALVDLALSPRPGPVHLDSNALDAWRFDELAERLKVRFARDGWRVVPTEEYSHDQRLAGDEAAMPRLSEVL